MAKKDIDTENEMEQVLQRINQLGERIEKRIERLEDRFYEGEAKFNVVNERFITLYWRLTLLTLGTISGTAALVKVLDYLFDK